MFKFSDRVRGDDGDQAKTSGHETLSQEALNELGRRGDLANPNGVMSVAEFIKRNNAGVEGKN